jgi:hypothetical protein
MATKRHLKQEEELDNHCLILKLIEERPAFPGAPELEALLVRSQTAKNLGQAGFPVSPKTLATKASRGGGPPYNLFGLRPLYRWRDALVWAHSRMTPPRRNSSEGDGSRNAHERREDTVSSSIQYSVEAATTVAPAPSALLQAPQKQQSKKAATELGAARAASSVAEEHRPRPSKFQHQRVRQ